MGISQLLEEEHWTVPSRETKLFHGLCHPMCLLFSRCLRMDSGKERCHVDRVYHPISSGEQHKVK